jgi:hypothetical protein
VSLLRRIGAVRTDDEVGRGTRVVCVPRPTAGAEIILVVVAVAAAVTR